VFEHPRDPVADLRDLRDSIDNIDTAIVRLLAERFRCTDAIGKLKAHYDLPSRDPRRETEQITRLRHHAALGKLDPDFDEKFLALVLHEVIRRHALLSRGDIENGPYSGIRAVQAGRDPGGLCRDAGMVIPTYCNDTVVRLAPHSDPAVDRQRLRETGRRLADRYLIDRPLTTNARRSPELSASTAQPAGES
jgi:chorismate mutase